MVTTQFRGLPEDADLTRADSLAREIFSDVANKWALLIINMLDGRTLRFTELRKEVDGISHKMLTQNLRMLERNGLVDRCVHPTVPPRVEYTLTEAGQALQRTVDGICDWTTTHLAHIESARHRFDEAVQRGAPPAHQVSGNGRGPGTGVASGTAPTT